jgi:glycolate oxidase FAD binding subunit
MDFVLSELCQQVLAARGAERPIIIRGGGTKDFYGEPGGRREFPAAVALDITAYQGIINYQPAELVITARAGTLLSDIEKTLDEQGQMLAFEPPRFGPSSTLGGCVAAGLSGPRRIAAGSLRDFVLGARLLDSSATVLSFGGEVMKNVAGYDVSRLLAGSMGIFGALLEVSVKVAPKPFFEQTCLFQVGQAQALALFNQWRSQPLPISATAWFEQSGQGCLYVRLSGSESAVKAGYGKIGGDVVSADSAASLWSSLRDHTHPFFQAPTLWRVALPPQLGPLDSDPVLVEWNGGQRWFTNVTDPVAFRSRVAQLGGHATLFRTDTHTNQVPVFQPLSSGLRTINWRLKQELDPVGLFNPKRLFPDF